MTGRPREPVDLILAKGKSHHMTKAEIEERRRQEIKPLEGDISAPEYLTAKQAAEFDKIADQLQRLKIMGETDVDTLARYVISQELYLGTVKKLRSKEVSADPELFESWLKIQDRLFKQAQACARDLGLTISSRCRLVVPDTGKKEEPENKFRKFEKRPTA